MKRPDLLLLVAIEEFISAFLATVCLAAIVIFAFPWASYTRGLERLGHWGAIFALSVFSMTLLVYICIAIAAGIGVLMGREWGRVLAIIHAALSFFSFPFGTTLGVLIIIYVTRPGVKEYFLTAKQG